MDKVHQNDDLSRIRNYLPDRIKRVVDRISPEIAPCLEELRINSGMPLMGFSAVLTVLLLRTDPSQASPKPPYMWIVKRLKNYSTGFVSIRYMLTRTI